MNVCERQADEKHRFTQILVMDEFALEADTHGYRVRATGRWDVKVDLCVSTDAVNVNGCAGGYAFPQSHARESASDVISMLLGR
jgi:hypothetical protein